LRLGNKGQRRPTFLPGAQEAEETYDESEEAYKAHKAVLLKKNAALRQALRDEGVSDEEMMAILDKDADEDEDEDDEDEDEDKDEDAVDLDAVRAERQAGAKIKRADLAEAVEALTNTEHDDEPITIPDDDDDEEDQSLDIIEDRIRDHIEDYIEHNAFDLPPKVSDEEKAMLAQLTDSKIQNLTQEQIAEIAGRLDLVNEDGTIRDPTIYPYSRNDWPEQMAERAKNLRDYADFLAAKPRLVKIDGKYVPVIDNHDETPLLDEDGNQAFATEEDTLYDLNGKLVQKGRKRAQQQIEDDHNSQISKFPLPYKPHEHKTEELRLDWPNTPLSTTGLTESVMQKVTFMAQRLPHGHWTPSQIAARYEEGYMVRFESEDEKARVLELAAQLANERAQTQTEASGETVEAQQMGFKSLAEGERGAEATGLVEKMVRGKYDEEGGKQSRAFLDSVVRQLGNNESYDGEDTRKFVGRVEALIGRISRKTDAGSG
jgi:hypothetical protein